MDKRDFQSKLRRAGPRVLAVKPVDPEEFDVAVRYAKSIANRETAFYVRVLSGDAFLTCQAVLLNNAFGWAVVAVAAVANLVLIAAARQRRNARTWLATYAPVSAKPDHDCSNI